MKILYAPIVILCLGLGACTSSIPVKTNHPLTYQRELLAVHHWDVMAADVANWMRNLLIGPIDERSQAQAQEVRPVALSVQQARYGSEAGDVFHDLLVTQLVNRGFIISTGPSHGFLVNYDIQAVTQPWMLAKTDDSEVVINASVMSGDRYVGRFSNIYYIPHENKSLYIARGPAPVTTRMMEIVGP